MAYLDIINNLIQNISLTIVDFQSERLKSTPPTQVSSEFLTNKEQGDWAEKTLLDGINKNSSAYIAVKYGRGDNIIAGEDGFKEFYENYQKELDTIGKRPDILIFKRDDFTLQTTDISNFGLDVLNKIVPKALCGIEVRSSAFLIDKYEQYMSNRQAMLRNKALSIKNEILSTHGSLLQSKDCALFEIIQSVREENLHALSFRCPSWKSTEELQSLSHLLKELKQTISEITKRTFLSITPKVEDLKVVYNWVKTYGVPHYYVQVFFDKAYGVSYQRILELLGTPALENHEYFIESDIKNQNKTTIKIHATNEQLILRQIDLPKHHSQMKELGRGRLLFYVVFDNSISVIDKEGFHNLFGFELQ